MASESSDYSVRRASWPQEIPGQIAVPQHKDTQKPPRRRPKRKPDQAPAAAPGPQDASPPGEDDDDGPAHLVDVLA